jgi:glycosyltransferase involved in cell wall biosynthesis|tara:strand:+ start:1497 stop:2585 length:1089 start_codon:yes stop_codon:yes gene_type:complete
LNRIQGKVYDWLISRVEKLVGSVWAATVGQRIVKAVPGRKGKLILLCRYRFVGGDKEESDIVYPHLFYLLNDSLKDRGDLELFYWDSGRKLIGNQAEFFESVLHKQPDVVIFYCYSSSLHTAPTLSQIKKIRNKTSTKFIAIWEDTVRDGFMDNVILPTIPFFDLHVINENPMFVMNCEKLPLDQRNKILVLYNAFSSKQFRPVEEKSIDIAFSGRVGSYRSYRNEYLAYLMECNIVGYLGVFESNLFITMEDYYRILGKSKIGLNFSFSVGNNHQLKGRVFETLFSGAMLLESENPQTASLFEEGKEYVSFGSKEDMVDKIRYYLKNDAERMQIAENGRRKVNECYNLQIYWDKVFEKVGL